MIRGRFLRTGDDLLALLNIRSRVFGDELHMPDWATADDADGMAVYALVYDEQDCPQGCGRLSIEDDKLSIGRVCVLKEARHQLLGDLIMRMLLVRIIEMQAPGVHAVVTPETKGFFARYGLREIGDNMMYAALDQINIEGECHRMQSGCKDCKTPCQDATI